MKAISSKVVGQYQGGAVVAVIVVEGKAVHDPGKGRHHFCSRGSPDVDAQVEPPGLGFNGGTTIRSAGETAFRFTTGSQGTVKMLAPGIERPMLIIAADAIAGLVLSKGVVDPAGKALGVSDVGGRETGIAFGEVEGKYLIRGRVEGHDRVIFGDMPLQYGGER